MDGERFDRCTSTAITLDGRLVRCMMRAGSCAKRMAVRHLIDSVIVGSAKSRENLRPGELLAWEVDGDTAEDARDRIAMAGTFNV